MVLLADLDERDGPVRRLLWWDGVAGQPFEWVTSDRFEATAERLYSYVFETDTSRWYLVTKGDGTIVTEARTPLPEDYIAFDALGRR